MRSQPAVPGQRAWLWADVAVAAVLTAVTWARVWQAWSDYDPHGRHYGQPRGWQVAVVLAAVTVAGGAAGARRWRPVRSAVAVLVAWAAVVVAARDFTIANLGGFQIALCGALVLYSVALTEPRRVSLAVLAAGLAGDLLTLTGSRELWNNLVFVALLSAGSWGWGFGVGRYRAVAADLRVQQAAAARAELDRERIRLARELHDVLAHSMSVVNVQAGYGRFVIDDDPAAAAGALAAIQAVSRDAMTEMRGMLTVLRDGSDGAGASALAPAPKLADLPRLVASCAEAGVEVRVRTSGNVRVLTDGVELAAYRIVQEALTNVVKHAQVRMARVAVEYGESEVVVEVVDSGRRSTGL